MHRPVRGLLLRQPAHYPPYEVSGLALDVVNVSTIAVPFGRSRPGSPCRSRPPKRAEAALAREHERSERLLTNVLPVPIAARLKDGEQVIADSADGASVLFADLVGFTSLSAQLPPARVVAMLDEVFSRLDALVDEFGLEKIKTIGDAYMVAAGVPCRISASTGSSCARR